MNAPLSSSGNPVLHLSGLTKRFGGLVATNNLDLDVMDGEIHGLIGPNGAGKSTLVSQIQGSLQPNDGQIFFQGQNITSDAPHARARMGIARSFQITSVFMKFTLLENVMLSVQARSGHSMRFWKHASADRDLLDPAMDYLQTVGLGPVSHRVAGVVSHGERRQLELAMALATQPKLLLLDEPMAGMGRHDGSNMIRMLDSLKGRYSILLVEHDMDAVFSLSDRVSVLVAGSCIASGAPSEIKANSDVRDAYLGHRAT